MSWREAIKKPAAKPAAPKPKFDTADDDWETDTNYQNNVTEKSQRYGSTSVPGSGRVDHVDLTSVRDKVKVADEAVKATYQAKNPNRGYGGKYGTEQVMDQNAAGFSYKADTKKHSSQTDAAKGYGGAYGVDQNVQDKSAVGFSHIETVPKHSSQTDYSAGFGGKYGVQKEEPTRPAPEPAPAAAPASVAKPAPEPTVMPTPSATKPSGAVGSRISDMKAKFENMKKEQEADAARRVAEERKKRQTNEQKPQTDQEKKESPKVSPVAQAKPREKSPVKPPSPPPAEPAAPQPVEPEATAATATEEKSDKAMGEINVSSILRERLAMTPPPTPDRDDNEWDVDQNQTNEPPPPAPTVDTPPEEPKKDNDDAGLKCIARYSYEKADDDELGFEENEIITHVEKRHEDWWFGHIGSRSGMFPAAYVEEMS